MPVGYATKDGDQSPQYAMPLGWANPCGGMYSTLKDVTTFMIQILNYDRNLLSRNGYEQYFYAGVLMADGVSSYGKNAFEIAYANGFRTLTKSGNAGGFTVQFALIPELKFGVFNWVNYEGGAYTSQTNANIVNKIVPIIAANVNAEKIKREVPSVIEDILGEYTGDSANNYVSINKIKETESTNIFGGRVSSYDVWYEYDSETTVTVGSTNSYFFRYFMTKEVPCFVYSGTAADNTVVEFKNNGGKWIAIINDQAWPALKKKEGPSGGSSTSSSTGSASSTTVSIALLFVTTLILCFFAY